MKPELLLFSAMIHKKMYIYKESRYVEAAGSEILKSVRRFELRKVIKCHVQHMYNAIKRCVLNLISTILIQTCPDILHT